MSPAPLFLALLIISMPAALVTDGPVVHGLVLAASAILIAIVALRIRPAEADFLTIVTRTIAIIAILPALWMIIQVLPLKSIGLENPIWDSAKAALGHPVPGSISIDPGATLVSLARYLSALAIAFTAAAVSIDRKRASQIFFLLICIATVIAVMLLVAKFTDISTLQPVLAGYGAVDTASLGVILGTAAAMSKLDRRKVYSAEGDRQDTMFWLIIANYVAAAAICLIAIVATATSTAVFAVVFGIVVLAAAFIIRRLQLGLWGYAAIVSVALVATIATITLRPNTQKSDLTLAFASRASAPLVAVSQRMLTETSWTGTGAGTFAAVLPIYQEIDEQIVDDDAPTAAAAIAVDLGRPCFWAIVAAALFLIAALLAGALSRGRDWIYATTAAGCTSAIAILAFDDIGLFSTSAIVIIATTIGIGLAQSKSRTI
jgi:hypothetical protein